MKSWIKEETGTADFGDKRINKRFSQILEKTGDRPIESLPGALCGHAETTAAYRFFNNDKVTFDKVLASHSDATLERVKDHKVILAVQDTTSIDYTKKEIASDLGHLESSNRRGIFLHPTILFTVNSICLGVYGCKVWTRDINELGKASERKKKPIEEKESYRWIESYLQCCEIANKYPDKIIISVGDREYDIYEAFSEADKEGNNAELVIRAAHNRRTITEDNEIVLLWNSLGLAKPIGELEVNIPRTSEHDGRKAVLTVKAETICLKAPATKKNLSNVNIQAVLYREENPPENSEPIEWLLLTTLPINNLADTSKLLGYYKTRWQIEIYFRTLKSGCQIEELQLEKKHRIEPCIGLYMIIAWRVLFLVMLGRKCPDLPADAVFEKDEWEIICINKTKKKAPEKPPTLNAIIKMIASLGGYLGRKGDGEPGPKHIWIGLRRVADFTAIYGQIKDLERCV